MEMREMRVRFFKKRKRERGGKGELLWMRNRNWMKKWRE